MRTNRRASSNAAGRRARAPLRSTGTRERIVERAARLFHEQGFAATGVSTILREANVLSGSLYHFFPSKDALLEAVLDRYLVQLDPELLSRARAATRDPVERVFALLNLYRRGMEMTGCTMGCPIGNLALEVGDSHDGARKKIEQNFVNWSGAVSGWLAQAADRFPAGTDFDALGRFVLVVMEGAIMQVRARKTVAPFESAVRSLRDYFERLMIFQATPARRQPLPEKRSAGNRNKRGTS
jgi:TetR/AcrR family transcriptional regulator, transcriptional repressor for nem operon